MPHCVLLAYLLAAADTGTIAGTVTDKATNAPLPAAVVTIEGVSRIATTNAAGRYRLAAGSGA